MTADHPAVSELQIARYREMTGEQRLETGLRLWEFAREFIAASIHNEQPTLSESEVLPSRRATDATMTERDVLLDAARRLDKLQLSYMLTGSLASMYYGVARFTHDDLVIQIPPRPQRVSPVSFNRNISPTNR